MSRKSFCTYGLICILSLITTLSVSAQEHTYKNYGLDEGLPSPETYFVHQDAYGYLWIGTDRKSFLFNLMSRNVPNTTLGDSI